MRLGVLWAETMRDSNGTPSASRISAAWRMVAQSDWLPMIRPTAGLAAGLGGGRRLAEDLAMLCSGDDIGNQLAFQLQDLVLEPELAFLQPLQLHLVERRLLQHAVNHLGEVAVLAFQGLKLRLDRLRVQRLRRRIPHAPPPFRSPLYTLARSTGSDRGR